jgi:CRISPR/Cas system Type II protein with McrA/HNH and RuvC-like nuclease domain
MAVTTTELMRLLAQQGYRCAATGRELTPSNAAMDHIVPLSRGGKHSIENIQILHRQVNAMKGTLSQEDLIALAREIVAYSDRQKAGSAQAS